MKIPGAPPYAGGSKGPPMPADATTAIVVYRGVMVDEAESFRFVLSRLPGFRTVTAGVSRGTWAGAGGAETADAALEEIPDPEIVALPGGIGCHRRTEVAAWLRTVSPRWVLTSSTGSALLAAAGLLHDATAATHWLAGPLLEQHGAHPSPAPIVVNRPIVTCSGASSAFRAALVIAEAYGGTELADRIRAEATAPELSKPAGPLTFWLRLWHGLRRAGGRPAPARRPHRWLEAEEPEVLDLGLMTPPGGDDQPE